MSPARNNFDNLSGMISGAFASDMLVVLSTATVIALVFERLRLPALLGFILAGTVIGPHGFAWITDIHHIHDLAELGMIFLMLTIGLEFSFDRLKGLKKAAFLGGSAQILLSIGISMAAAWALGWSLYQGFVLGSVIALSSTAIVFRNLIDRGQLDSQHGRLCVAILVFQDLAVGPLLIFINSLGGSADSVALALGGSVLKAVALLGGLLVVSRYLLPGLMRWIALSRSREIFVLATVLLCFGTSWVSAKLGLSAPLGAFFAGLMLANTDYHHQISGEITPFRHIFLSIFFVSIGLLFDPMFAWMNWATVIPVAGLILFVNVIVIALIVVALGYSPRVAVTTGILLSQIGEFSFLLLQIAEGRNLIDSVFFNTILSAAVVTILLTPFMFNLVPLIMKIFSHIPFLGMAPQPGEAVAAAHKMESHVILCGYGTTGQDLAATMMLEGIPFVVIEMSPANIRNARGHNVTVIYGDAMNEAVLHEAGVEKARAVVISFSDSSGIAVIIRAIKGLSKKTKVVARCRFERDIAWLYEQGADVVVMEELVISAELTRAILDCAGRSEDIIRTHILRIRARKEFLAEQNVPKT